VLQFFIAGKFATPIVDRLVALHVDCEANVAILLPIDLMRYFVLNLQGDLNSSA